MHRQSTFALDRDRGLRRIAVRSSLASYRFRLSSIALVLTLLFALVGLFAADRALSASNRAQVEVEAAQSAALVEGFLAVHAEALQSVRGLYLDTTHAVRGQYFHSLVTSMTRYAASFRWIFLTDTTGRIIERHPFGAASPLPLGVDIDTVHELSMGRLAIAAQQSRGPQVTRPGPLFGDESGVVLLQPIYVGSRFMGIAGGAIGARAILMSVDQGRGRRRGQLVVLSDRDTVASSPLAVPRGPGIDTASAGVHVPGQTVWRIVVAQRAGNAATRPLLWGIGLATLAALIVMLLHERRQGIRLADRSAELERLSSELLRANRAKSEFLANVSHELRTPLNAIVGFVELLRDGVYGMLGSRQIAPVERIASSANHLRQLVDQILDLARIAAGRLDVHAESVDLHAVVMTAVSEIESLATERGLSLSVDVSPTLPRITTDPLLLRQILMNLFGNAIKFTSHGGIVVRGSLVNSDGSRTLRRGVPRADNGEREDGATDRTDSRRPETSWIVLDVEDTGIGIPETDRERIFDEFEQVNAGPRGDSIQRGTGLGLAISRRLARTLGGEITLESVVGRGSTFTIWLPLVAHAAASIGQPDRTPGAPHAAD